MADERIPEGQPPGPQGSEKSEQKSPEVPQASSPPQASKPSGPPAAPKPAAAPPKPAVPAAPKAPAVMAVQPWESELTSALKEQFGDAITEFSTYLGQNFLVANPEAVVPIIDYLKMDAEFDYLADITAVEIGRAHV